MEGKENSLTTLDKLKEFSIIVADTGDINLIKEIKPTDATTNPSLLVKAVEQNEYSYLVQDAIEYGCKKLNTKDPNNKELIDLILDRLYVNFGKEIL
jgi:transaldolase